MTTKLPVGIQDFEKLITERFKYVDKTEYIYRLVHDNVPFFLSRPRRFGKSLLLSTLRAYWEGKKELFKGLMIEKLEKDNRDAWKNYPVFYFDFNGEDYENTQIEEVLDQHLCNWEEMYGNQYKNKTLGYRFEKLLEMAYIKTGLRCVILVDEYDKPLLDAIEDDKSKEHTKKIFKGFFGRLKKADQFIQFIFITGVSKFHKVSIFSDLNQLADISLNKDFSGICGITDAELEKYFDEDIRELALEQNISYDDCLEELKTTYDGYCFHPYGVNVYNPYSLLNAFYEKEFGSYWFSTGTPTFLVSRIFENEFDPRRLTDGTLFANENILKDYTGDNIDIVPLLFQTGYLTISGFDRRLKRYTLRFPNAEVKYGFLESLMPVFVPKATAGNGLDIFTLTDYIEHGEVEKIREVLISLFANIPYTSDKAPFEHYFQSVIYIVFTLLGKFSICEMHTFNGRIDCKVETSKYIYLFEFKRDSNALEALQQIDDKGYTIPFLADKRKLIKIGVSFDSLSRMLSDWKSVRE